MLAAHSLTGRDLQVSWTSMSKGLVGLDFARGCSSRLIGERCEERGLVLLSALAHALMLYLPSDRCADRAAPNISLRSPGHSWGEQRT